MLSDGVGGVIHTVDRVIYSTCINCTISQSLTDWAGLRHFYSSRFIHREASIVC